MLRVGTGLVAGVAMFMMGQTETVQNAFPFSEIVASTGAVGVLGWAVWYAYMRVIPKQQEQFAKTLDTMGERFERMQNDQSNRHERWEATRHADSEKLTDVISSMSIQCARTREAVLSELSDEEIRHGDSKV